MLRDELHEAICELPIIDVHSHLNRDHMAAGNLREVVFYHMITYALRAAGMDEKILWPGEGGGEPDGLFEAAMPHWQAICDTGFGFCLQTILRELYDFDEPITPQALPRLREQFAARTGQADWDEQVRARAGIRRILSSRTDVQGLDDAQGDKGIRFTVESSPTSGTREMVSWPERLRRLAEATGRDIRTLEDLREIVAAYYDRFDWSDKHALVAWVSSEAEFVPVPDAMIDALVADCAAGREIQRMGRRLLEAALIRCTCAALRGRTNTLQICYGTQYVTPGAPHPITRAAPHFASSLACLVGQFPDIHFNILSGFEADEPTLCSLCLGYSNVSLAGYWWGGFYPSVMHAAWQRRLEMVPAPRLCGFFSDGWCIEWTYARVRMTQRVLANVLAEKVDRGFYTKAQALRVARAILFETPGRLFLPDEQIDE